MKRIIVMLANLPLEYNPQEIHQLNLTVWSNDGILDKMPQ